jgi:hypothetical protein
MKVIIAGSRDIEDYNTLLAAIKECPFNGEITEVVSGGARGVDRLGEKYARESNLSLLKFIPDWETHGKRAGYLRNTKMAKNADALIAIWDGESNGTKHMIETAKSLGLKYFVYVPT